MSGVEELKQPLSSSVTQSVRHLTHSHLAVRLKLSRHTTIHTYTETLRPLLSNSGHSHCGRRCKCKQTFHQCLLQWQVWITCTFYTGRWRWWMETERINCVMLKSWLQQASSSSLSGRCSCLCRWIERGHRY